jgi:two-component system sensor kinase
MTIRKRLSLGLLALTLSILFAVSLLYYFQMRQVLEQETIKRLEAVTALKTDRVFALFGRLKADVAIGQNERRIRRLLPFFSRLLDEPVSRDDPGMVEAFERQTEAWHLSSIGDLLLADQHGRLVYVANSDDRARYMKEGPPGPWRKTLEAGKIEFTLSDLFRLPEEKGEAAGFAFYGAGPVYSAEGQFLGTVVIQLEAGFLFRNIQSRAGLENTGETLLVAQVGEAVHFLTPLRHDPDAALTRTVRLGETRGIPVQWAATGGAGADRFLDYRGIETVSVFRPLIVEGKRWGIVSKIDLDEATLPIKALSNLTLFLAGVSTLVILVWVFTTVHFLVAPIRLLHVGVQRLGEGDLDYRIGLVRSDEIGELSAAFDRMADSLHAAQGALKEKADALARSNEELSTFSYSVSHDLRAPLRAISGFAGILSREHESQMSQDARECLSVIQENARRMDQLITALLAFSRLGHQAMTMTEVDMNAAAQWVVEELKLTEPTRALQITLRPLPPTLGDRILLHQVWTNLLSNAIKYTRLKTPALIEVWAEPEGDQVRYSVKDNGVGFDSHFVDKLFKVFQRLHTQEAFEGTGVGLALVQRIIHRHGGRVGAEGAVNEGATFYFTLPKGG